MSRIRDDEEVSASIGLQRDVGLLVEEFRRRNVAAVAMDLLYLFTIAFFSVMLTMAWEEVSVGPIWISFSWPAVIGAIPLVLLLYFGWRSSKAFFLSQLLVIVLTVLASSAGLLPF